MTTTPLKMYRQQLLTYGVTVVPCLTQSELKYYHNALAKDISEFPEYLHHSPPQQQTVYVQGAFGALGNPASFHNPTVRRLRLHVFTKVAPLVFQGEKRNLCLLLDRVSIRRQGTKPGAEQWHRDKSKLNDVNNDDVHGGWLNLDLYNEQGFSCVLGTHTQRSTDVGFVRESNEYDALKTYIRVPPGHLIIFYQNIVHEVLPIKSPIDSLRLYVGWYLTFGTQHLFNAQKFLFQLQTQAVIPLPSEQMPPMYSSNH